MIRLIVILFLMPLVLQSASAKRIAPVKVDPLVYKGVRYVAPNDDGRNGGDDFEWMDSWKVYSKTRAAHAPVEINVRRLRGDALLVEKSEAASALIYWNGKKYVWF